MQDTKSNFALTSLVMSKIDECVEKVRKQSNASHCYPTLSGVTCLSHLDFRVDLNMNLPFNVSFIVSKEDIQNTVDKSYGTNQDTTDFITYDLTKRIVKAVKDVLAFGFNYSERKVFITNIPEDDYDIRLTTMNFPEEETPEQKAYLDWLFSAPDLPVVSTALSFREIRQMGTPQEVYLFVKRYVKFLLAQGRIHAVHFYLGVLHDPNYWLNPAVYHPREEDDEANEE